MFWPLASGHGQKKILLTICPCLPTSPWILHLSLYGQVKIKIVLFFRIEICMKCIRSFVFCKHWIFIRCLKGAITFLIGFTGCVGALRENTALLAAYAIFLAILLLLEMTAGILGFIFKDWVGSLAFMSKGFYRYNDIIIRPICQSSKMKGGISLDKAYTLMF